MKEEGQKDNVAPQSNHEESSACVDEGDLRRQLEDEIKVLRDAVLRKAAELENLRKRLEKEIEDAVKYSNGKFAKDLLVVEDNFERVLASALSVEKNISDDAGFRAILDGVSLCKKELTSVFKKHGIARLEVASGDRFDPQRHEAVCEAEGDGRPAGVVIQVFQEGYAYHNRLLRPAMVSVSKKA
jgi:molecular chaperone GrpE